MAMQYKKLLPLSWEKVVVGQIVIFKKLRESSNDTIQFQIGDKGVSLQAHSQERMNNTESRLREHFRSKIQLVDFKRPAQLVQQLVRNIKELTQRLREQKDCPYINLITNEKILSACKVLASSGFREALQNYKRENKTRPGFCLLIVKPEYRFGDILGQLQAMLVRMTESRVELKEIGKRSTLRYQISYRKFMWLYFRPEFRQLFQNLRYNIQIFDDHRESLFKLELTQHSTSLPEVELIERHLNQLELDVLIAKPADWNFERLLRLPETEALQHEYQLQLIPSRSLQKLAVDIFEEHGINSIIKFLREEKETLKAERFLWVVSSASHLSEAKDKLALLYDRLDSHKALFTFPECKPQLGQRREGGKLIHCTFLGQPFLARAVYATDIQKVDPRSLRKRVAFVARIYFYSEFEGHFLFLRKFYKEQLCDYLRRTDPPFIQRLDFASKLIQMFLWLCNQKIPYCHDFKPNLFYQDRNIYLTEVGFPGPYPEDDSQRLQTSFAYVLYQVINGKDYLEDDEPQPQLQPYNSLIINELANQNCSPRSFSQSFESIRLLM